MGKTQTLSCTEALTDFVDVVYLSDKRAIPGEIRRLFRKKGLSSRLLPLDDYPLIRTRPDLVGTVIVDAEGADANQNQPLARILECLERDNLGTILITELQRPVRSFSLVPSDSSFSVANKQTMSLDMLSARISVNLADRKKQNAGITFRPPASLSAIEKLRIAAVDDHHRRRLLWTSTRLLRTGREGQGSYKKEKATDGGSQIARWGVHHVSSSARGCWTQASDS